MTQLNSQLLFAFEILVYFCWLLHAGKAEPSRPSVKAPCGSLEGIVEKSRNGRLYKAFKGIPYGKIPQRFVDSVPADPWTGTFDASEFGTTCIQSMQGEEDCLFLNVYTPYLVGESKDSLPVIFYIHGGSFIMGSSEIYNPNYLMDEDVVVVTINYRLGIFGFLNLGLEEAPGNQGLKDQVLALKWVQQSIKAFNGDPSKVLIAGESAGAASVSFLMLSPLTKGLFHAALSHSGTAICPWSMNHRIQPQARILAAKFQCSGTDVELVRCLRNVTAEDFISVIPQDIVPMDMGSEEIDIIRPMSFIPSIETRPSSPNSIKLISGHPLKTLTSGNFPTRIPWIVGVELTFWNLFSSLISVEVLAEPIKTDEEKNRYKEKVKKLFPDTFFYKERADKKALTEKIFNFYFKNQWDKKETVVQRFTDVCSDTSFFQCSIKAAKLWAKKNPTYLFMYRKAGLFSFVSTILGTRKPPEPTHADDITALWVPESPIFDQSEIYIGSTHSAYNFSVNFVHIPTQLAITGQPIKTWNSKPITWEKVQPSETYTDTKWLQINDEVKMVQVTQDFAERMKFWDAIYTQQSHA